MARITKTRAYMTVGVLFVINLLNYMDRFTVAGVLSEIETFFDVDHSLAGLLQTVFIVSYMTLAPVFGYLGDRYSRKIIMIFGLVAWTMSTFGGTFVNKHQFWLFFACRGLVGIGEASYSTVASTVIGDLFVGDLRTRMLSIFYFAIPVGSGLGYVVGSKVSSAFGHNWKWGLRVTPMLGVLLIILCALVVVEPVRGAIEKSQLNVEVVVDNEDVVVRHSWFHDIKKIVKCKTYVWTTVAFTLVCFVTGALAWWAPIFMGYAQSVHYNKTITENDNNISLTIGGITCAAGFIGVALGSELSRRYRQQDGRSDALVCAFGLLSSLPFLFLVLIFASKYTIATWLLLFVGETLLFMNWCPVADILLAVIPPQNRATASAFQILISHLLGDAGSPFVVGQVADIVRGSSKAAKDQHRGLLYGFYITPFVSALSGACFLIASFYLVKDRAAVKAFASGESEENRSLINHSQDGEVDQDTYENPTDHIINDPDDVIINPDDVIINNPDDNTPKAFSNDVNSIDPSVSNNIQNQSPNSSVPDYTKPNIDPIKT